MLRTHVGDSVLNGFVAKFRFGFCKAKCTGALKGLVGGGDVRVFVCVYVYMYLYVCDFVLAPFVYSIYICVGILVSHYVKTSAICSQ